jgi:metal-sulfur cluster biosynthetic enzyme
VQSDLLDQSRDLRLSSAEKDGATPMPKAARQRREVEHQRCVSEHEAAEIHRHVGLRAKSPHERPPAAPLGRLVLVPSAAQRRWLFVEVDDGRKPTERAGLVTSRESRLVQMAYSSCTPDQIRANADPTKLGTMVTVEDVTDALRDVIDPELGLDFVELGLVYDVEVEDGNVRITYTLTSPGCPIGPQVSEQMVEFVSELDGVQDVQPTMTFSPPWTPDRMSEDAKFALGF